MAEVIDDGESVEAVAVLSVDDPSISMPPPGWRNYVRCMEEIFSEVKRSGGIASGVMAFQVR